MTRRLLPVALLLAACAIAGCERNDATASFDPQYDGLLPTSHGPADTTILQNQATLYAKYNELGGAARPAGGQEAPANTPAPAHAPGSTTPPPPPG